MKVKYISNSKRRYVSLGKEFPNKKNPALNEIEVADDLGKLLLLERSGGQQIWQEIK